MCYPQFFPALWGGSVRKSLSARTTLPNPGSPPSHHHPSSRLLSRVPRWSPWCDDNGITKWKFLSVNPCADKPNAPGRVANRRRRNTVRTRSVNRASHRPGRTYASRFSFSFFSHGDVTFARAARPMPHVVVSRSL